MPETKSLPRYKPVQYVVDEKGDRVGVLLDLNTYAQMVDALEDAFDHRLIAETKRDARIPLSRALANEDRRRARLTGFGRADIPVRHHLDRQDACPTEER